MGLSSTRAGPYDRAYLGQPARQGKIWGCQILQCPRMLISLSSRAAKSISPDCGIVGPNPPEPRSTFGTMRSYVLYIYGPPYLRNGVSARTGRCSRAGLRYRGELRSHRRNGTPVARLVPLPEKSVTTVRAALAAWRGTGRPDDAFATALEAVRCKPIVHQTIRGARNRYERAGGHQCPRAPGAKRSHLWATSRPCYPRSSTRSCSFGVHLAQGAARAEGRRAKIRALLSTLPIVDFTLEIAEQWAELFTTLSRRGRLHSRQRPSRGRHRAVPRVRCPCRPAGRAPLPRRARPPCRSAELRVTAALAAFRPNV